MHDSSVSYASSITYVPMWMEEVWLAIENIMFIN